MARVLLATRNPAKLAELRRVLAELSVPQVEVVGLDAVEPYPEPVETGATFTANALLKARAGAGVSGLLTVADDSGLCADALGGLPGVLSARWSGVGGAGRDAANVSLLLAQLADTERRDAAFVCAAALVAPDGAEHAVLGTMRGRLARESCGEGGFGYDPIFVPEGCRLTSAEMTPADKDAISHRGRALRALAPVLAGWAASVSVATSSGSA